MVKQEEEKYYFERFINIYPLISNKKWRKDESPDFYVYLDNNTFLGIEMEEIVQLSNTKKSKLKEIETLESKVEKLELQNESLEKKVKKAKEEKIEKSPKAKTEPKIRTKKGDAKANK